MYKGIEIKTNKRTGLSHAVIKINEVAIIEREGKPVAAIVPSHKKIFGKIQHVKREIDKSFKQGHPTVI